MIASAMRVVLVCFGYVGGEGAACLGSLKGNNAWVEIATGKSGYTLLIWW